MLNNVLTLLNYPSLKEGGFKEIYKRLENEL